MNTGLLVWNETGLQHLHERRTGYLQQVRCLLRGEHLHYRDNIDTLSGGKTAEDLAQRRSRLLGERDGLVPDCQRRGALQLVGEAGRCSGRDAARRQPDTQMGHCSIVSPQTKET